MSKRIIFLLLFLFLSAFQFAKNISFQSDNIKITSDEKDYKFAKKIVIELQKDSEAFQRKMGAYPNLFVKIIIAKNKKQYQEITKAHTKIIEFSQAHFNNLTRTIYIRNPKDLRNINRIHTIIFHEYIHQFVGHYWKNPPLWFNEGMAVFFSEGISSQKIIDYTMDFYSGNSRTLKEMMSFYPENRIEWDSFYLKSALAVKYLYQNRKKEFLKFWEYSNQYHKNFEPAFTISFMTGLDDFSLYFEEYIKENFKAEMLFASTKLLWYFLPIIFLFAIIAKKLKNRKILKKWSQENEELLEKIENNPDL